MFTWFTYVSCCLCCFVVGIWSVYCCIVLMCCCFGLLLLSFVRYLCVLLWIITCLVFWVVLDVLVEVFIGLVLVRCLICGYFLDAVSIRVWVYWFLLFALTWCVCRFIVWWFDVGVPFALTVFYVCDCAVGVIFVVHLHWGFVICCCLFWVLIVLTCLVKAAGMLDYFIVNSKCLPLSRFFSVCTIS